MDKKHLAIGFFIAAVALYLTFRNVSLHELITSFQNIRYGYLLPAVILAGLTYVLRAYRWKFLISALKVTSTSRLMGPLCIGFLGNLLPARAGELIRAYLLGKKEGIGFSASLATIVLERVFDFLTMLAMTLWLVLYKSDLFENIDGFAGFSMMELLRKFGWFAFLLSIGLTAFSYALLHWHDRMIRLITIFVRPFPQKFGEKALHLAASFTSGLHILKDWKSLVIISLLSLVLWALITLANYPMYFACGFHDLPLSSLVVLQVSIAAFITIFPTPGFLGAFQIGCVLALHNIFQVSDADAASFGVVTWVAQFGLVGVLGSYYIVREGISFKQLARVAEEVDV